MVENLAEQSLIAQRIINDHVHSVANISCSKELLLSAAGVRQKHQRSLEDQRREKEARKKSHQKRSLMEEVSKISAKKK
ncbi:UNVERIFIED_CONTAM: hypothetical protein FKN15_067436 [Acipenser sinensis]